MSYRLTDWVALGLSIGLVVTAITIITLLAAVWFRRQAAVRHMILFTGLISVLLAPVLVTVANRCHVRWSSIPAAWLNDCERLWGISSPDLIATSGDTVIYTNTTPVQPAASLTDPSGVFVWHGVINAVEGSSDAVSEEEAVPHDSPSMVPAASVVATPVSTSQSAGWFFTLLPFLIGGAAIVWVCGTCLKAWRLLCSWRALRRIQVHAIPTHSLPQQVIHSVRRSVPNAVWQPLYQSPQVLIPVVIGWLRPRIVLPTGLVESLSARELQDVLTHEAAHIRRRDNFWLLLQQLACTFYWPIPFVHLLSAQLSQSREELCDNYVLQESEPVTYGETLLKIGRQGGSAPFARLAVAMLAPTWGLRDRIRDLIDPHRCLGRQPSRQVTLVVLGLFALVEVVLCGNHFVATTSPAATPVLEDNEFNFENSDAMSEATPQRSAVQSAEPLAAGELVPIFVKSLSTSVAEPIDVAEQKRQELQSTFAARLHHLDQVCDLSRQQRKKLQRVGNQMINRYMDQWDQLSRRVVRSGVPIAAHSAFPSVAAEVEAANLTESLVIRGDFVVSQTALGSDRAWLDAVESTLDDSQRQRWLKAQRAQADYRRQAWIARAVARLDQDLLLNQQQRQQITELLQRSDLGSVPRSSMDAIDLTERQTALAVRPILERVLEIHQLQVWEQLVGEPEWFPVSSETVFEHVQQMGEEQ